MYVSQFHCKLPKSGNPRIGRELSRHFDANSDKQILSLSSDKDRRTDTNVPAKSELSSDELSFWKQKKKGISSTFTPIICIY